MLRDPEFEPFGRLEALYGCRTRMEVHMSAEHERRDKRVLKIAVISIAVIEAIAMVPLILHLANR